MRDGFQLKPERRKTGRFSFLWNCLTVVVLLSSCGLVFLFMMIFVNPSSPYNPFPPQALPTLFQTITPTSTIIPLQSTWTATVTIPPEPTRTTAPTWTLLPILMTATPTVSPAFTATATPTQTLTPTMTPNYAATLTQVCKIFRGKFPGTPCP
jgi:hypothetical protein